MRNGQLKPAYNIQYGSSGYFIIGSYISHHPSDMHTLPLFVEKLSCLYPNKLNRIAADAGYESEENDAYLKSKVYRCFYWSESQKTKSIYITEKFDKYRQESLDNITSKEGIVERV